LKAILSWFQSRYAGAMYSGCGGGYMIVVSEEPVPGSLRVIRRVRRSAVARIYAENRNSESGDKLPPQPRPPYQYAGDRGSRFSVLAANRNRRHLAGGRYPQGARRGAGDRANFAAGRVFMAEEFLAANGSDVRLEFEQALPGVPLIFEPHVQFKKRVPQAVGLIRTGDTTPYANMIVESG
jgi:hypothetical protein